MQLILVTVLLLLPACSPSARSRDASDAFAILSPAAGEAWEEGKTYVIRWRDAPWSEVSISVAIGGKDKGHLVERYPAAADSLVWTVPPGFVTGFGPVSSSDVRLRFEHSANPSHYVDSPRFTVRGSP